MTAHRLVRIAMDSEPTRITVLFALMVLMLQISAVVTDKHRTKRLAEAVCNPGTTKIKSPNYYRENSADWCGSAAGLLNNDFYNLEYRQECQRWMGGSLPDMVAQVQLSYCFEFDNATVLYRISFCCHGEPSTLRCFNGQRHTASWSTEASDSLNYKINYEDQLVTCQSGEVCQKMYTWYGRRGRITNTTVAKGCARLADCEAINDPNTGTCKNCAVETPSCTTCCNTPFCNFEHQYFYNRPGDCSNPCDSGPCKNGGTCANTNYDPITEGYEDYFCFCTVFWGGRNCTDERSVCDTGNPCLNGGTCYDYNDIAAGDYRCVCPTPFFGDNCELQSTLTCASSDSNYWIHSGSSNILTFIAFANRNCTPLASYVYDYPERSREYYTYWEDNFLQRLCGATVGERAASYRIEFQLQSCSRGTVYGLANYHSCCFNRSQCAVNPCLNGGTCYDYSDITPGDYRCECPSPFIGDLCELNQNGLTCNKSDQFYVNSYLYNRYWYPYGSPRPDRGNCTPYFETTKNNPAFDVVNRDCMYSVRRSSDGHQFVQGVDGQIKKDRFEFEATYCSRNVHSTFVTFYTCCPTCLSSPCQNGGYCQQEAADKYVCKCRVGFNGKNCENRVALCVSYGDPHFKTFDDKYFSYQGTSKFNLASPCNNTQLPYFKVSAKSEYRAITNPRLVSWPSYVEIDLGPGKVIRFSRNPDSLGLPTQFSLNGRTVPYLAPYLVLSSNWIILNDGRFIHLATNFGLGVIFDGGWLIGVFLPVTLNAGQMCGMCGNHDGNPENDLTTADGTYVGDSPFAGILVGESHKLLRRKREAITGCDPIPQLYKDRCQLINNTGSLFGFCIGLIGLEQASAFAATCMFDACNTNGSTICSSIQTFVEICEFKGASTPCSAWLTASNCPAESFCPDGMIYKCSAPACLATCVDPYAPDFCPFPNKDACVCPDGELLYNGTCTSSCPDGCVDEHKQLIPVGVWPGEGCTTVVCEECENCTAYTSPTIKDGCPEGMVCLEDECVELGLKKPPNRNSKPCMKLKTATSRRNCLRRKLRLVKLLKRRQRRRQLKKLRNLRKKQQRKQRQKRKQKQKRGRKQPKKQPKQKPEQKPKQEPKQKPEKQPKQRD